MSLISQMSFQNPWWTQSSSIDDDDHVRRAKYYLPPIRENLLILGPRQVGKTTYMKTVIRDLLREVEPRKVFYFSCDSLSRKDELIQLLNEYRTLVNGDEAFIFLDEITSVDAWNMGLLHLFNAGYFRNSLVYVSGSSSLNLSRETLPGRPLRKVVYYPLNFRVYFDLFTRKLDVPTLPVTSPREIMKEAKKLIPHLSALNKALLSYVERGGFFATNLSSASLYETYRDTVLSEIAKTGRSEALFKQVISRIIESYGSRISDNGISKEISVSHTTVSEYLELLERLFITRTYRKWENGRVNYRSLKKVYMIDPFLFRVMKRYSLGKDLETEDIPHVIEGIVGEHLSREYAESLFTFFKDGREVDFLVRGIGIEVKWSERVRSRPKAPEYVLTMDEFDEERRLIPVSLFLYLISSDKVFYDLG
ncbi:MULTISPECIES: ATP-binding protein [Metallosphaera]|uniref:ATP-binding protein n=1 Tax=Metallosphaera TaxID=41980 RepID=UPI001F05FF16|nr:ATP-binding protein [Metallosphaera sedula]MCH1771563.1 ATP-binding protein [Metallosphaera sedula]MCP6728633.1 ATP-binding protein [Metallosphaera sedula]